MVAIMTSAIVTEYLCSICGSNYPILPFCQQWSSDCYKWLHDERTSGVDTVKFVMYHGVLKHSNKKKPWHKVVASTPQTWR
jgi:hypothetical protein